MHSSLQLPCQLQYMREGKGDLLARGFTLVVFSGAVCASTLARGACTFGRASILSVSCTLNLRVTYEQEVCFLSLLAQLAQEQFPGGQEHDSPHLTSALLLI